MSVVKRLECTLVEAMVVEWIGDRVKTRERRKKPDEQAKEETGRLI